jgi:dihydrofolate synthase / folylpolyglutamate synthase
VNTTTIHMNYQQTIDYLFTRLPMFSRTGAAAYKADLINTIKLCDALDNPHNKFKSIHIAGTNGKGSVSHMLAAIMQTAGYKTGLYTSPHLKDFRERVKINGKMIPEKTVIDFTERMKPLIEEIEPSFFEITVAMAFDHFASEKVDIAIIETGLGGRLDSTNIITPELSVITNIGMDHMNILGDTLEKIAAEKAGIIKPKIPVVIGKVLPETAPVFESVARQLDAPLSIAYPTRYSNGGFEWISHHLHVTITHSHRPERQTYELDLPGVYQIYNLITVLEACSQLKEKGWHMDDKVVHTALKQVKRLTGFHGRWEVIQHSPLIVLDVAHNEDGIFEVIQQIEHTDHTNLYIVIGMVKDKDVDRTLQLLPHYAYYYFTKAQIPRALPEEELAAKARAAGLEGETWGEVNAALKAAKEKAKPGDMILVCGSVFLVGEVM